MNRIKFKTLVIIIGVLLISNLLIIGLYLFQGKDKKRTARNGRSPIEYMTRELGLDETQARQFTVFYEENNQKNKPLNDSIRARREQLYQYLRMEPQPDSLINAEAEKIAGYEKQLMLNNYAHFRKLNGICSAGQQVKLDTLLRKMGNRRVRRN
ncbi:hypothetical protein [Flavihumibacter fluvii]|uniref:hypothetical protein n=1 Tax=Flavihumibacter fluvii TaxID=2838157 RepID=UPI001BDEE590|nr:hypothetical protein [Flavihumibacter fluvii]ULQ52651.1 hypothetical protein KJS93_21415 [Flavihumibacter fluvii]